MSEELVQVASVPGCAGTDGEAWFSTNPGTVALCQRICAGCPLRRACLAGALARDEQYGIWGGRLFSRRWVSGRVFYHQGWWAVGQDGHGVQITAFSRSREALEHKLTSLLADGARRGRAIERVRAIGRPAETLNAFWTGPWATWPTTPRAAADLGAAA